MTTTTLEAAVQKAAKLPREALKRILARVPTWPQAAQNELLRVAREIEEDLVIGPHLHDALDEAHDQSMLGTGPSLDDLREWPD